MWIRARGTHVDDAFIVADEQVAEDAGFVEVAQTDHVLHPVDGGRVHGFDVGGILRGNRVFLCEGREVREDERDGGLVLAIISIGYDNLVL